MVDTNKEKVTGNDKSVDKFNTVGVTSDEKDSRTHGYVRSETTRSGHAHITGDYDGKEFILMQHRSGSGWVYNADGSAKMVIKNGFYSEIQGEYRMQTTGDYDIRSKRHASLRTEGNYSLTSHTTQMTSHDSSMFSAGGGIRFLAGESMHMAADGVNIKSKGQSPVFLGGSGKTTITGANLALTAKAQGGGFASLGGSKVGIRAEESEIAMTAATAMSITVDGGDVRIQANRVYINSGPGTKAELLSDYPTQPPGPMSDNQNPILIG